MSSALVTIRINSGGDGQVLPAVAELLGEESLGAKVPVDERVLGAKHSAFRANSSPAVPTESITLHDGGHGKRRLAAIGHSLTTFCTHTASDVSAILKDYRNWSAANRRRICSAFQVDAVKDWLLPDATYVLADAFGQVLNVSPWRRDGKRDAWVGTKDGPMATAPISNPEAIGAALKGMLAIHRLPAR